MNNFTKNLIHAGLTGNIAFSVSYCVQKNVDAGKQATPLYPCKERYFVRRQTNSQLSLMYDCRTRNPRWVLEVLSSKFKGTEAADRKKLKFYKDKIIDVEDFRVLPNDYSGSGYSRGHLAPAGDFSNSQDAMEATFSMTNICPQSPELNRGYWSQFEAWIRRLLNRYEEVVVITGPAFLPILVKGEWIYAHKSIGSFPRLIQVPTHFFKVIIVNRRKSNSNSNGNNNLYPFKNESEDSNLVGVAAFLIPNDAVDAKIPLSQFVVKLSDLENLVGLRFFDDVLDDAQRKYLDSRAPNIESMASQLLLIAGNKSSQPHNSQPSSPSSPQLKIMKRLGDGKSTVENENDYDYDSEDENSFVHRNRNVFESSSSSSSKKSMMKFSNPSFCHLCDDVTCVFSSNKK